MLPVTFGSVIVIIIIIIIIIISDGVDVGVVVGLVFPSSAPHCAKLVWDGGLKTSPILFVVGPRATGIHW